MQKIRIEKISGWIREQLKASGAKGIVVGLSGGIDSCVVAALVKKAIGLRRMKVLVLPIESHKQDLEDAKIFAKKFGIRPVVIDLTKIYAGLRRVFPKGNTLAYANLKPRLRMLTLYYFANRFNYLVCGTSNKSELSVGYFTKFGDGAADILPIGGLLKTQVRAVAAELKIPDRIIAKAPSAGLAPGQTDEEDLGLSYEELDDFLSKRSRANIRVSSCRHLRDIKKRIERSAHKRRLPPVCSL